MLRVVNDVTLRQHITNEVLYAGLPRISTTIREGRLRFSGHCWRSKNEVVSDLVLWEPKLDKRNVGGQARTFVDLLEADTEVPRDYLPAKMEDRVGWRKKAMGGGGWGEGEGFHKRYKVDLVVVVLVIKVASKKIVAGTLVNFTKPGKK